jgi:dTDP-4-dehydrorhamnose reductase
VKVLVTGRDGQIAKSLVERAYGRSDIEIETVGRPEFDLTKSESVFREITSRRPGLVVSAAAYTAVDRAEEEPDLAWAVNADGAGAVSEAAAAIGVPVIHLSTDYVFPGDGDRAYTEQDKPSPNSVYGRTKLAGEAAVAAANSRHIILRTAWIYSPFGRNFLKTMLELAKQREVIGVVSDQFGNPTSALDIADGILHIAGIAGSVPEHDRYGIFHIAGTGSIGWSGFAEHIFAASREAGGVTAEVQPIATSDYHLAKAKRPLNSRLSTDKLHRVYGWRSPAWQDSCSSVVHRLMNEAVPT